MCNQSKQSRAEDVRAEYAAITDYHNSNVTHRLTLVGLYLAAVAIIVQAGMTPDRAWLVLGLTVATYIIERRNRVLYTVMGKRAMEIEEKHWQFNRSRDEDKTVPLFCRLRLPDLSEEVRGELPDELQKELKALRKWWTFHRLSASHSRGIDLIYIVAVIYAIWKLATIQTTGG